MANKVITIPEPTNSSDVKDGVLKIERMNHHAEDISQRFT